MWLGLFLNVQKEFWEKIELKDNERSKRNESENEIIAGKMYINSIGKSSRKNINHPTA